MISMKSITNDAILSLINNPEYNDLIAEDFLSSNPAYVAIRYDTHFDSVGFEIVDEQGKGERGYWSVLNEDYDVSPGVVLSKEQQEYVVRFRRRNPHVFEFTYKFENDDVLSMAKILVL